jgi:phosphatidylserine decarboxylase
MLQLFIILESILISTVLYLYLRKKTRIRLIYLFIDNIAVIIITAGIAVVLNSFLEKSLAFIPILLVPILTVGIAFGFTMIRFWRTPKRKVKALSNEIASPADGNVIYIKEIASGEIPVSIKKGLEATLSELSGTALLNQPSWLIGINMTPFDVHKNCAPVSGRIVLNKHINGEFLSLKHPEAILRNERNTLVIQTENNEYFGIIQTASKLVRRIDSYVKENDQITQGKWFGMIRFGSQVDLIIPKQYLPNVKVGQQIFAATSIIAKK